MPAKAVCHWSFSCTNSIILISAGARVTYIALTMICGPIAEVLDLLDYQNVGCEPDSFSQLTISRRLCSRLNRLSRLVGCTCLTNGRRTMRSLIRFSALVTIVSLAVMLSACGVPRAGPGGCTSAGTGR